MPSEPTNPTVAAVPVDIRGPVLPPTLVLGAPAFWDRYKAAILGAVALVVLGSVGSAVHANLSARKASDASTALAAAKTPEDYQRVMDRFPGTTPAADALLLLARAQREKGDPAAAEKTLRTFVERFPQHPLTGGALLALAGDVQTRGPAADALPLYQQAVDRYPNSYSAPLALLSKAELQRNLGKTDDARRTYETLIATYGQSLPAQQATQALRYLRAPAPPVPVPPAPPAASPAPAGTAASPEPK